MKILVTGASGLVGTALVPFLERQGHEVFKLVRQLPSTGERSIFWDPASGQLDTARLAGFEAVVHLAGDNIGSGRWTATKKARIRDSRIRSTQLLCDRLAQLPQPPAVLVCASAVGVYGNRGQEVLVETSHPGGGFLAEVCRDWEAAADSARQAGIRTVHLRFGMVLSAAGGALARLVPVFRFGLGGVVGDGEQYWNWIAIDDALSAIDHALRTSALTGPVNAVAPEAVTNRDFTQRLGRVLGRPTLFPLPTAVARLVLGEMAGATLLASARAEPARLLESGFEFRWPTLTEALRHLLSQPKLPEAS